MLKEYISELIRGKSILIAGFGREGRSSYRLIAECGGFSKLAIADRKPVSEPTVQTYSGDGYLCHAADYDIIFKSPGVVMEGFSETEKIISQTDVMLACFKDKTVGVTGTKGKSTTASLIYHILKSCGKAPTLMGNIGIPAFEAAEAMNPNGVICYEMSCHQLEYATKSPHIGVLLNIYPEHLDHYGSFKKYRHAKENIYRYMEHGDFLVCADEVAPSSCKADILTLSIGGDADCTADAQGVLFDGERIEFSKASSSLFGAHNMYNIGAAYAVCTRLGVGKNEFLNALGEFKALSHRLEHFATIDGVRYFDDSISTIPETAIRALSSIENVGTLILGGMDRGISLDKLAEYLICNGVPRIILMPDTGNILFDLLKNRFTGELYMTGGLEEAAAIAKQKTKPCEACVLSPAAASYGFYKNFEERGDAFKNYITK